MAPVGPIGGRDQTGGRGIDGGEKTFFRPLPGATTVAHWSHGLRRGPLPFAPTGWRNA